MPPEQIRREARKSLALRAVFQGAKAYLSAWTANISAGGLSIFTDEEHTIGQQLQVSLSFPGLLDEVIVHGDVVWVRARTETEPAGLGLSISDDESLQRMARVALLTNDMVYGDINRAGVYRVVVVEPPGAARDACRLALDQLGRIASESIEVVFAKNGEDALNEVARENPDLFVTDIAPPHTDTLATCTALKNNPATHATQVMVIADTGDPRREELRVLGVNEFIDKPIQLGRILETIVYLIHLRDVHAESSV